MKSLTLLLALSAFAASAQTIRIADNNANRPTGPNIYGTIQAAHDAAVAGDIVFVQPSPVSYGSLTINKQITLRGIGFNTGKDLAHSSTLGNITLTNRTDNTSNASGTTIEGVVANDILVGPQTGTFSFTLQNIIVQNCAIQRMVRNTTGTWVPVRNLTVRSSFVSFTFGIMDIQNVVIHSNYLRAPGFFYSACGVVQEVFIFGAGSLTNMIMSNNIIAPSQKMGFAGTTLNSIQFSNNIFFAGTDIAGSRLISSILFCDMNVPSIMTDVIVTNNIFYGYAPNTNSAGAFERNVFSNNLSFGTSNNTLPPAGTGVGNTGANNIVNQDPMFVSAPYNTAYAATMNFNLQASSPAKNAGSDGTDIGITGGAYPVAAGNILLQPTNTPVIMQFNPAAMVPQNQPVKTNIKVKAN